MLDGNSPDIKNPSNKEMTEPARKPSDLNDILYKANRIILKQQTAVTEEERLNVLFQILGITLHELNQPLTSLLGNIELMMLNQNNPQKLKENTKRIEEAGMRFSHIIRKIQNIRQERTIVHDGFFCPLTGNNWNFLLLGEEAVKSKLRCSLSGFMNVVLTELSPEEHLMNKLKPGDIDLLILDETCLGRNTVLISEIKAFNNELPIMVILKDQDHAKAFELIRSGADEYCMESDLDESAMKRAIHHARENAWARHQMNSAVKDLSGMSILDEHTGLFQRRFFKDALERDIIKVRRNEIPGAACKLDIDGFMEKIRSDGRTVKPNPLMETATIIQEMVGKSNLVCRYGNESFSFILSGMLPEDAVEICGKLQSALEQFLFNYFLPESPPQVFIGMVQFSSEERCLSAHDLMKKMEEACANARIVGKSPLLWIEENR